ncbi:hypothetical protein [Bdellovibrio sp. KM01]|uniref:hypothetical protein n=1 Tax=Bdellovibrio sp. KM01 TaxID=2748865 RepID=UPI0015E96282|nr:hypothetical protein [Bdellovibrio sp. KM01]QLY25974.1 hypothetical protein HW988_02765 [Bdellovibrio sp. KM01]
MSMITFSENHESSLISFEAGTPLANITQPREEALKWAYSLGPIPSSHVVVIGLGSGFHIEALADLDQDVQITVVDSRASLIPVFRSQFPELAERVQIVIADNVQELMKNDIYADVVATRAYVVSFRESWGEQMDLFSEFFGHLTGRTVEAVKYHLQDLQMNMKSLYFQNTTLLSIKDILPVVEGSQVAEEKKQIFRMLGELVK